VAPPAPRAAEPVAPRVSDAPAVPTWSPPELTDEPVAPYAPPELPERDEPAFVSSSAAPPVAEEPDADLDVIEKKELDAWTRAAQELFEARRLGQNAETEAPVAPAPPVVPERIAASEPPRFPGRNELEEMAATANPATDDLSGLPARLREKIEADIADEARKQSVMPWLMGAAAVATVAVSLVLLQRFAVIDVPVLRALSGTAAASDSLRAAKPAPVVPPAPDSSAATADSSVAGAAAADSAVVIVPPGAPVATKANPFPAKAAPPAAKPAVAAPASAPTSVFGIGVAAFLDRDRAEAERTRLESATGLEARIYPFRDGTTTMYRLVLGRFASNAAAENAANGLMQRDQVREARVLVIGGAGR